MSTGIKIKKITIEDRHAWYEDEIKRLGELLEKTSQLTEKVKMLELSVQEKDSHIAELEKQLIESSNIEEMYQDKIDVLSQKLHTTVSDFENKLQSIIISRIGTVATIKKNEVKETKPHE
jgi:hypothetical protein